MKPDNWNRFAAGLLAILLCLCSFSMPVFASGTDPAPEPLPEIAEEEPTTGGMEPEGVSITPKGNATLVDDFYGDKQLITVTTKAGNYFYILIDRANEDKETSVHFLNQVDDADLLALFTQGAVFVDVSGLTFHRAGADLGGLRFFIQQSQQVGIVHLVQKVDRSFLVHHAQRQRNTGG